MLNFRKMRQDFSSNILKEGKELFDNDSVLGVKILHMDADSIKVSSRVRGAFENVYESEVEIDRSESCAVDSNCDCTYTYDCQHIAAFLYYLEKNLSAIVVNYSEDVEVVDEELQETFEQAQELEVQRKGTAFQKELLSDYQKAATSLSSSPFFLAREKLEKTEAELALLFGEDNFQLALRLPSRSKPLFIPDIRAFLTAIDYKEPIHLNGKRYFFTPESFDDSGRAILSILVDHIQAPQGRTFTLSKESVGQLFSEVFEIASTKAHQVDKEALPLPSLFLSNLEEPISFSISPAHISCTLEYLEAPGPTILLNPSLIIDEDEVAPEETQLFASAKPGVLYKNTYYRFPKAVKRAHLLELTKLRDLAIPEPLFGTFVENALPVLRSYAEVTNPLMINRFVTLPFTENLRGRCEIHYLNNELEAKLFFIYGEKEVPVALSQLKYDEVSSFARKEGILARDLVVERKITEELFEDFLFDESEGSYRVKSEKKIVEFMTEIIPKFQDRIDFQCPENLKEQFIYDETTFELKLSTCDQVGNYACELIVNGHLKGIRLDLLWDCVASKRAYVEIEQGKGRIPRILVLDLEKITPIVQLFDELGLSSLDDHVEYRPLWSLTTLQGKDLPVKFTMTKELQEIQKQILGEKEMAFAPIPKEINAQLRNYQELGVNWLQRLRDMHLGGILADDMGLGKTLQAICAIVQNQKKTPSLIVCPTSLLYNWQEEFHKFHPQSKVLIIDSIPVTRRKRLKKIDQYDIIITSYNLLQKDIETYKKIPFDYVVLDEAQHIKNRGTRNAKSAKMIQAKHKLILTGTPIENSLDELWSLFDFLMPGLLSSYDRFVERFIRGGKQKDTLEVLRRKVSPFILRRMKEDVLDDLPPVTEVLYHCHLTPTQEELYKSYAASAREELSRLVKKEGFDKIQIHVLATLTRLKQICCHPAIFAKEKPEPGDSAKYDMLLELLLSLIEGGHKTVVFSQYTKMLSIMREEFESRGIPFAYLDGSSKNRLGIVKQFNSDPNTPLFLISLKAGGTGLNLTGADTVIHYDMWWNPAVENQATDRVHRIGQQKSVSSYKMVTLNTIEEKILNLQKRKKSLVKKVIDTDEETISKLTWEEVLELLQT